MNQKRTELLRQLVQSDIGGKKLPTVSGITTEMGAIPTSSTGYINTQPDSNKAAAFIPYVFLLEEEYTKLQSAFNLFSSGNFTASNTEEFTKYLLQTLGAITGDDLLNNAALNKVIMSRTLNEIWNDYLQVPCGLPFAESKLIDLDVAYSNSNKSDWEKSMDRFKEKARIRTVLRQIGIRMVSCAGHCRTLLLGAIFRFSWRPIMTNPFEMIEVNNLTCEYAPGTPALSVHELNIRSGELTFVVGASGSGKSTLPEALDS